MSTPKVPTLRVNLKACTGCRTCTIVCAVNHEHRLEFAGTRIRVEKSMPRMDLPIFKPIFCRMCRNAKCIGVCPTHALVENPETGVVELNVELCNGCGECVRECPFHAIWVDERRGIALKCDLCDGDPTCVAYCPSGALAFEKNDRSKGS